MLEKRIAIFVYYGWVSISPSLVSTIRILTENGYFIDVVYLYDKKFGYFNPDSDKVHVVPVKPCRSKYLSLLQFLVSSFKVVKGLGYSFFVGVDQEGIIVAGILSKIKKVPCIFYSLEIVAKEDIAKRKPVGRLLLMTKKFMESYFSREANITVVQDKYRASILTRDNAIDRKKIFIVPNSYYFTSRRDISYDVDYLQIPANKKIIIYTGSVIPEMAIKDIIKSIDLWPKETLFMLHTPYRTIYLERIKQFIKQNNLEYKVLVSIKRLSFEELCSLINKAHIGIALYKPVNKNYYLTPSGKVSFYLAQGIPIIVNDVPLLKEFVSKYKCGMYIEKAKEIGNAVKVILKDYPSFSVNAKICYQQELKFSRYFGKVMEYMNICS